MSYFLLSTFHFPLSTAQYNPLMLLQRTRIILFFVMLAAVGGYAAQNKPWPPGLHQVPELATPLSPEEALKTFYMPPGYRIELVASEPLYKSR